MHKSFVLQQVYFMPLRVSRTCARHQEVKIALHSLWYRHTYRWPSCAQVERGRKSKLHYTASDIVTPIGGRLVHRLREDASPLSTCARERHL